MTRCIMPHGTMSWCHMEPWRITTWMVLEEPPKGHKHVTFVTCMYGHHCDKCHKLRYLKKISLGGGGGGGGGGTNNSLEREKKHNKRKSRRNKRSGWRNKKQKKKLSINFYGVPTAGVL